MSWENIIKMRRIIPEVEEVMPYYNGLDELLTMVKKDMEEVVSFIMNDDLERAEIKWDKMKGGILDLEGTFTGIKDVNAFITRLLGDA
tara:strand:- start:4994 stop:5257 length:264 start_codon:yes stop_codon:yes gene_type:complete